MLRGELHNRGSAGRCEACGEIFPCATALAILAAVKNDVEQLTSSQRVTDGFHCPACGSVNIGETSGGLPLELRSAVRAAVESTTE